MKTIQMTIDERLLARLDSDDEVRRDGRSAVVRRAIAEYLRRRRSRNIAERYRRAYPGEDGLGREFAGWGGEGVWPET